MKTNDSAVLRRLLTLVAPFAGRITLAVGLGLATVLSGVGLMATGAWLIAGAALALPLGSLQLSIVGVRFFGIARGAFRYAERLASHDTTFRVLARLRVWFYGALIPLAPARLQRFHSGDLLTRILDDIHTLENFFVRALAPVGVAILTALGMTFALGRVHLALGLGWLLWFVLAGAGVPLAGRWAARVIGPRAVRQRADLNHALVDGIQGLPDLLSLGQAQAHAQHVARLSDDLLATQRRLASLEGLQEAALVLFSGLGMLTVLVLGIPPVRSGELAGRLWVTVVLAALSGFEAVQLLPTAATYLAQNLAAARRLFALADTQPAVSPPAVPRPLRRVDLQFQAVRFRYAPERPWALDGLSFDLPPGKHLALVGPSGAGKSSVIRLLLRFWDYDQGRILLGGYDLRAYDPADVRRACAVVSQTPFLFSGTIRENLLLARPDADEAALRSVVRQAHLEPLLRRLPAGYDTWIGEHGARLSGGERQRLALARALLQDAPLLLFDEPTVHLDPRTEAALLADLLAAARGRSLIWITHRSAALPAMDEILVLHHGRVVERGTHAALLARRGRYHWMFGRTLAAPR